MIRKAPRRIGHEMRDTASLVHVGDLAAELQCQISTFRFLFVGALFGAIAGPIALRTLPIPQGAMWGSLIGGVGAFGAALTNG